MIAIVMSCVISACGGSADSSPDVSYMNTSLGAQNLAETTGASSSTTVSNVITKVEIVNSSTATEAQSNIPIRFGQVFRPG